ncbi:hypothetical protein Q8G39_28695, partial [Klebsiella pneumoniae]|uniref:hypothetical protein n=1 Tax=Klebsiella pneumoniae TaxID=573 RepID=UPI003013B592
MAKITSGIMKQPKMEDIKSFQFNMEITDIFSMKKLEEVAAKWKELKVPEGEMHKYAWDLAIYCAHVGSSKNTEYEG